MKTEYANLLRALVAAQMAVFEHENEELGVCGKAKKALLECLAVATRAAKRLDD